MIIDESPNLAEWNNIMYAKHPTRRLLESNFMVRFTEKARFYNIIRRCGNVKDKRIMEIGCEQGLLTSRIPSGYKELVAIDISSRAIEDAKKLCKGKEVKFVIQDGTRRLDYPDGYFDVIICSETLEHVPKYPAMIAEMGRLLNPAGRLIVTVPYEKVISGAKAFLKRLKLFSLFLGKLESHTSEWHVNSFDKKSISKAMEPYFHIVRIYLAPFPLIGPRIIIEARKRTVSKWWG